MKLLLRLLPFFLISLPAITPADVADDVTALTGAHTRVVWVRDGALPPDPLAERDKLILMGFDNQQGGEHAILPNLGSYFRPLITADGQQVVFSNLVDKKIYVVNWDGSGLKAVVSNALFADIFTDSETKITWVYAQTSADGTPPPDAAWKEIVSTNNSQPEFSVVRRFRLDDPSVSEIVWDKTPVAQFQVSPNGIYASGSVENSEGLFILPNDKYIQFHGGCWPSMAPDGSQRMWIFNGSHKGGYIMTQDLQNKRSRTGSPISFINAPGVPSSNELYHPRWGNHIRFITITGPYWYQDWDWRAENKLSPEAAAKAEIYLGRLNTDIDMTEAWVRITDNQVGDFFGDSWIDLKANPQPVWHDPMLDKNATPSVAEWPVNREGLLFLFENNIANNQIEDPGTQKLDMCTLTLRDHAIWGRHNAMDTANGAFLADDSRNAAFLKECQATNEISFEMVILPATNDQTGVIASFGDNFVLEQQDSHLMLYIRTSATDGESKRFKLAPWNDRRSGVKPGHPVHLIITYSPGVTSVYSNGIRRGITDVIQGDLSVWEPAKLVFGDTVAGGSNWAGTLENVAFFNRTIGVPEAREHYLAIEPKLKERKLPEPVVVQAKLIKTTSTPDPASIAPYRRCLSVNVYEIEKVEKGALTDPKIMVAQWSILDAQPVPAFAKHIKGQVETLKLEPFSAHPELEGERMVTDMDDIFPLFYDATR